jgi:hypothetical protein
MRIKLWFSILIFISLSPAFANTNSLTPKLRCEVTYAGTTQSIITPLSANPYEAPMTDVYGRFHFKAVMAGTRNKIDYIKLYAYFQGEDKDYPLHQASYLPPFRVTKKEVALTPHNYIYGKDMERELQYQCYLSGVK